MHKVSKKMFFKKINHFTLPLSLFLFGICYVPLRYMGFDLSWIPGDLGVARLNMYILEHGFLYLNQAVPSYWDANFLYPAKNVIAFSDNHLGTLPIYALFRWLKFDYHTAFQLWIITLFTLNFWFAFKAFKDFFKNNILAAVGAYIFAFGLFNLGEFDQIQVFPRFMIPLIFYWLYQFLYDGKAKYFQLACFGLVFQFYCGIYLGLFTVLIGLIFLICSLLTNSSKPFFQAFQTKKSVFKILGSSFILMLALLPLIIPYAEASKELGKHAVGDILTSIPTLKSYILPFPNAKIWGQILLSPHHMGGLSLQFLFPGILILLSVLITPFVLINNNIQKRKKLLVPYISLLIFILITTNINGFNLYKYLPELPGFSSIHVINKIINTQILFFILIFGYSITLISNRYSKLKKYFILLPVLVILDNTYSIDSQVKRFSKQESIDLIDQKKFEIRTLVNGTTKAIAYEIDKDKNPTQEHINVMLACQELYISCVNGYSENLPKGYMPFFNHTNNEGLVKYFKHNGFELSGVQFIKVKYH